MVGCCALVTSKTRIVEGDGIEHVVVLQSKLHFPLDFLSKSNKA